MKLNRITIGQVASLGQTKVLDYKGKLIISDHIAQEYLFEEPCRLDAVTILVCLHGRLDYTVNLEEYQTQDACILVNMPENIIQFRGSENLEAYAVLVSTDLINSLPFDMLQLANSYLPIRNHFHAPVAEERLAPLLPFYQLIKYALSADSPETDEIIKSLLLAFLLSIIGYMREQNELQPYTQEHGPARSSRLLYERFMDYLKQYHQQERMVQFYAEKLCVTPKYLSTVIKQYSGKSPSDWICEYVIAEAKSLLHYSQLSVQEVAYHLNFPSQSSFGKFFKQKTGYSPMQYIKGSINN